MLLFRILGICLLSVEFGLSFLVQYTCIYISYNFPLKLFLICKVCGFRAFCILVKVDDYGDDEAKIESFEICWLAFRLEVEG